MQTLLEMSISGAVMIGVIIIVRALAVNRLPKTAFWHCGERLSSV